MSSTRQSAPNVLLVEDNPADAQVATELVRDACGPDVAITHVKTLRDGLDHIKADKPDVVVLDLGLPDSHGHGTLGIMLRKAPDVPVVVVTGYDDVDFGIRALRMGATGYLFKSSLKLSGFQRAIDRALGKESGAAGDAEAEIEFVDTVGVNPDLVAHLADLPMGDKATVPFPVQSEKETLKGVVDAGLAARLEQITIVDEVTIPILQSGKPAIVLSDYVPDRFCEDVLLGVRDEDARIRLSAACDQLSYTFLPEPQSARKQLERFLMDSERDTKAYKVCRAAAEIADAVVGPTVRAILAEHLAGGLTSSRTVPGERTYESLALVSGESELLTWQQLIMDPDGDRRVAALRALPTLSMSFIGTDGEAALRKINQMLFWAAEDDDEQSSITALAVLARLGVAESAELLIQRYRTASTTAVRAEILDALGELFEDGAVDVSIRDRLRAEIEKAQGRPSGVEMTVRAKVSQLATQTDEDLDLDFLPASPARPRRR